ncbi:MAG: histidinol dehydrogenase [Halieaceae bacterium]|jgi:histidinol dehydrogenase|nr:histidinol dehydrogenase [Halieaceae bacterium]
MMRRLDTRSEGFSGQLAALTAWQEGTDRELVAAVDNIVDDVIARGDAALLEYTRRFDEVDAASVADLELDAAQLAQALQRIPEAQRAALQSALQRITDYHQRQLGESWNYRDGSGSLLGQRLTPLERVGVYVPGGKASYPSSVLMNVTPARVAGVDEIIMVTPTPRGQMNDMVLAAAALAGVDRLFCVGGAQAVAALAYGTETVPRVDKIVGPGNRYVATAKRRVFGQVGIDMVAGPSEILIICDGKTPADWIAMDLFSQAEHDENAQSLLVSPDADFLDAVEAAVERLLPTMSRADIIRQSLEGRGALIRCRDLEEAASVSNQVAPEHLELSVEEPEALAQQIRHAGAIFLGRYSAEAFGDYCAGPNHVLPTSGTARFSSPLGVYDFQKRSSLIMCSREGVAEMAPVAAELARGESLEAHAMSAEYRLED